ncbi:MAG TPA: cytochrome P450 [Ramlibacter sp.]|nr:cytochrome P450 [Ramlibacter sp.]
MAPDFVHAGVLRAIPAVPGWDQSLQFLADPYRFIGRECRRLGSDVVLARLMLQPTLCLSGPQAADLFDDRSRVCRADAALQGLEPLRRHPFNLATRGPAPTAFLLRYARAEWERLSPRWRGRPRLVLYEAAQEWLVRTGCRWAGLPLAEEEVPARTRLLVELFDPAATGLVAQWRAQRARWAAEGWLGRLVQRQRAGEAVFPPGTPAAVACELTDAAGERLPARMAAAELLAVLRPIVAVSVFVALAAHALHLHPAWRPALAAGRDRELDAFAQEVRRFYPAFAPATGLTCREFVWEGWHFPRGARVMLDLYGTNHDARAWPEPMEFRPERFLGAVPGLFDLRPHGGARGPELTVSLMKFALQQLAARSRYRVPAQDLRLQMDRTPALPVDRLVVENFSPA